eukprot:GEMP01029606.1.p1 GENE.GEMP01029606.1~~GEMP01029606.1.p1  ORF type:complete len:284 (+),score=38.35 GEMP01029606.1:95-853(+)
MQWRDVAHIDNYHPAQHWPQQQLKDENKSSIYGAGRADKTHFCKSYPAPCRNINCQLAHSREEISSELLTEEEESCLTDENNLQVPMAELELFLKYRFKTLHCPFGKMHDWQKCPYAHNSQDIRRDPRAYNYSSTPCWRWKNSLDHVCPLGHQCSSAHGLMEALYHPDTLRTKPCYSFLQDGHCRRGLRCAYNHHIDRNDNVTDSTSASRSGDSNGDAGQQLMKVYQHFVDNWTSEEMAYALIAASQELYED